MTKSSREKSLARVERVSDFLDSSIPLGNTSYRIGMDPLIGLIPGIGDSLSALIGSYIVVEAACLGASRFTLVRMIFNLGFDALVGSVPVLGDLFDFTFKANQRNVRILKEASLTDHSSPEKKLSSAVIFTLLIVLTVLAAMLSLVFYAALKFSGWLFSQLPL